MFFFIYLVSIIISKTVVPQGMQQGPKGNKRKLRKFLIIPLPKIGSFSLALKSVISGIISDLNNKVNICFRNEVLSCTNANGSKSFLFIKTKLYLFANQLAPSFDAAINLSVATVTAVSYSILDIIFKVHFSKKPHHK